MTIKMAHQINQLFAPSKLTPIYLLQLKANPKIYRKVFDKNNKGEFGYVSVGIAHV